MALTKIITELITDSAVHNSKIANDAVDAAKLNVVGNGTCLLYTSPSPRDLSTSRMPSSA